MKRKTSRKIKLREKLRYSHDATDGICWSYVGCVEEKKYSKHAYNLERLSYFMNEKLREEILLNFRHPTLLLLESRNAVMEGRGGTDKYCAVKNGEESVGVVGGGVLEIISQN